MATTVVSAAPTQSESGGMGFFFGIIVLIIAIVAFFVYGLPVIQKMMDKGVKVTVPPIEVTVTPTQTPSVTATTSPSN